MGSSTTQTLVTSLDSSPHMPQGSVSVILKTDGAQPEILLDAEYGVGEVSRPLRRRLQ